MRTVKDLGTYKNSLMRWSIPCLMNTDLSYFKVYEIKTKVMNNFVNRKHSKSINSLFLIELCKNNHCA